MRATRLSVANYNTTLSSDSLATGTGSSNSLPSAKQSLSLHSLYRHSRRSAFTSLGMPRKELRGPQGLDTPPGSMESSFAAMMKSLR
jgi:hypothetical protein